MNLGNLRVSWKKVLRSLEEARKPSISAHKVACLIFSVFEDSISAIQIHAAGLSTLSQVSEFVQH